MMMTPKQKEFKLKSFKLTNAKGAKVTWSYMFSKGNAGHQDDCTIQRTLIPHKQLLDRLKLMKDMVLRSEEIDYARKISKIPGMKISKEVEQAIEGSILDLSSKIEVTGVSLSGKDEKMSAVITYKKIAGNKKVSGRSTTGILLAGNIYGFEQELEELLQEFQREVYAYLYEDKFSDMEQTSLYPEDSGKEVGKKSEEKPKEKAAPKEKAVPAEKKPKESKTPKAKKEEADKK